MEAGWVAEGGGERTSTHLAEAERIEDLIGVVVKALGMRVMLDHVLVVPLVRGEEHDHVEKVKRQSVLRASVDGLVANAREASAGPAIDQGEGDGKRAERQGADAIPRQCEDGHATTDLAHNV